MSTNDFGTGDRLNIQQACIGGVVGFVAGFCIQKSSTYLPSYIIDAFNGGNFYLWKLVIVYTGAMMLLNAILSVTSEKSSVFLTSNKGLLTGALGSACVGAGMAIAGSDLLILCAQAATGTTSSLFVFLGVCAACFTSGIIVDKVKDDSSMSKPHLTDTFRDVPFWLLAAPLGVLCLMGAVVIDDTRSKMSAGYWQSQTLDSKNFIPDFQASQWNIYSVGFVLALAQLGLRLGYQKKVVGYAGWICGVSFPFTQIKPLRDNSNYPDLFRYTGSLAAQWTTIMSLMVAGGFLFAGSLTKGVLKEEGPGPILSFSGGMLLMSGALICGGDIFSMCCGISELHIPSVINMLSLAGAGVCAQIAIQMLK